MMASPCAKPGCPNLVSWMPHRHLYCEDHHALNDDLEPDMKDWVWGILDKWVEVAREDSAWLKDGDEERRSADSLLGYATSQLLLHAPEVTDAAAEGRIWTAVRHALWVGLMAGHSQQTPQLDKLRRMEPHAARGRRVIEAASEGGKARRRGPPEDVLARAVTARHEKWPALSWAAVCQYVGEQHGLSRRTVEDRLRGGSADWRAREHQLP